MNPAVGILTLLGTGAEPLNVHDTHVDVDETLKVVTVPLPYVTFRPVSTTPQTRRADGTVSSDPYWFEVMWVGLTREQAEAARDRARARLEGKRPVFPGSRGTPIARHETTGLFKEPTYTAPGGAPLFYGIDQFLVVL